jgi:hypothetical protein
MGGTHLSPDGSVNLLSDVARKRGSDIACSVAHFQCTVSGSSPRSFFTKQESCEKTVAPRERALLCNVETSANKEYYAPFSLWLNGKSARGQLVTESEHPACGQ